MHIFCHIKPSVHLQLHGVNFFARLTVVKGDICAGIGAVVGNVIPVFLQLLFKNIMHFGRTALLKQSAQAKVDFGGILHQRTDFGRHGVAVQHQAEAEFFDDFVNQLL